MTSGQKARFLCVAQRQREKSAILFFFNQAIPTIVLANVFLKCFTYMYTILVFFTQYSPFPLRLKATFTQKHRASKWILQYAFTLCLHKADVGDDSVIRARYPLCCTFMFVCVYGMHIRCFCVNVKA